MMNDDDYVHLFLALQSTHTRKILQLRTVQQITSSALPAQRNAFYATLNKAPFPNQFRI
jgi:hypothetical protein